VAGIGVWLRLKRLLNLLFMKGKAMENAGLFYRFGISLFIGVLIGLQREHSYEEEHGYRSFAGVRTFALMGLLGCTAAFAADLCASPWAFVGLVLPFGFLIAVSYFISARQGDLGMTTEVAALITVLAGAVCYWEKLALAVALAVTTTGLLSLKLELHGIARRISRDDVMATLKFAVISAIILPVLPDRSFGPAPFDSLNPRKIWVMIVLISSIGFLGYNLLKLVSSKKGIGIMGLLGGLVSSTAVTLTFVHRSKKEAGFAKSFALAIIIAWVVMFGRVLVEVSAVNMALMHAVWLPMVCAGAAGLAYCIYLCFAPDAGSVEDMSLTNPFELGPAIKFGLIYGSILLFSRLAHMYFADTGVYIAGIISGIADVDAITLSMAELSRSGKLDLTTAGRTVVLAAMTNTVVKGGFVLASGSAGLRKATLPGILLILAVGITVAFVF
jgi:uncharacterized membrane protein (DUF4010 family)